MPEIKELLNSIIDNTNSSYEKSTVPFKPDTVGATITKNNFHPQTKDAGKFREQLSLYVLHDLISAMMHDETTDLDEMVDKSIMNHINTQYNGSCYDYLCGARDRCRVGNLKSPILSAIIQEVDSTAEELENELAETKDEEAVAGKINIAVLLKDVTNYDEFRKKLKEQVSKQVVDDVASVITQRNDAPVFDNVDDELNKEPEDDDDDDVTQDSVILKVTSEIVTESYRADRNNPISTEDAMNIAIVEYCLHNLDLLTKSTPKQNFYAKYNF